MHTESFRKPAGSLRLALWLICLCLGLSGRLSAAGLQLPLQNAGTWGSSPATLIADIERALRNSGFLDAVDVAGGIANEVGQGRVPTIDELARVVEGDVQNRVNIAIAQADQATQLLALLDVTALRQLFETLQSTITTPQEFAVSIPGGRLVFRRDLVDVSLCAVIAGPGGARVTLGMSNGAQLCGNPAERFVNPTREAVLFADLALGYTHLQARRRLPAVSPIPSPVPPISIEGATYFKIHDDWVQLRLAGSDPQALSLKLSFVVGVRLGFSAKIQAQVEGQLLLELTVNPTQVASLLFGVTDVLRTGLGSSAPASLQATPAAVAGVLQDVFAYLKSEKDKGEEIGELSISMATDAGLGVGIYDTGINLASVGAQFTIGVPLDAVVGLRADLLSAQLEAGMTIATQAGSLMEAMSEGRLDSAEMDRQLGLLGGVALDMGRSMGEAYFDYLKEIRLSYEAGIYGLGDIGQAAAQTIPILVMTVDIPLERILTNSVNGGAERFANGVVETARAGARLAQSVISAGLQGANQISLGQMIGIGGAFTPPTQIPDFVQRPRGSRPNPPTIAEWQSMATDLLDDVTLSFRFGALGIEGASMGGLVRLMGGAAEVAESILVGAVRSAVLANEKPLLDALRAAPGKVGDEAMELLIFNLQTVGIFYDNSLGASGTVGAEVAAGIGGRIAFDARLKASLVLLAQGSPFYDEEDDTLLAGIDIPLEFSASGGVVMGKGVAVTVEGGLTVGTSLANLTLKDWGQDLPVPAGLTVAGFEVIEFVGTNRQDGTVTGRGWLVLPQGGLVRANHFMMDAAGRVLGGEWEGVIELGPFGEKAIAGGLITDDGLVGDFRWLFGTSELQADFLLHRSGLLFGNAVGKLNVGGLSLADVRVSLTPEGSFSGTAVTDVGGATSRSALEFTVQGEPKVRLTGTNVLGGITARLDLLVDATGGVGTANVDILGQPVGFDVLIAPDGKLTGTGAARLSTPWGIDLVADLKLDEDGVHGSGRTRILGSEFVSDNLRILPNGRITGSFNGALAVDGYQLVFSALEIQLNELQGRTTIPVAQSQGVELLVRINRSEILGSFVSRLDLFGAGNADAWVRITDRIDVFGEMDGDFLRMLERVLRERLVADIQGVRSTLAAVREQLERDRNQERELVSEMERLREQILAEQQTAREIAAAAVVEADRVVDAADAELNKAIEAVRAVSGAFAAELDRAEAAFWVADSAFAAAQGEVNKINGEIARLDRWYNGLNPFAKGALWLWYQGERAFWVTARDGANLILNEARNGRNLAESALREVQRKLADAAELVAIRDLKDQALALARADAAEARRNLTTILETILDPTLDLRHVALALRREAVLLLIDAAEKVIAATIDLLGEAATLINHLDSTGDLSVVRIDRVNFRSRLAELNNGFTELIVDAVVAGIPRQFVMRFDLRTGHNEVNIATAARLVSPELQSDASWTVLPWTDDASSGIAPDQTLWAYRFNSTANTAVSAVPVIGLPGTSPAVVGRFSVEGFQATFTGDVNALTSGTGGSSTMAANFIYAGYPGTVTFMGLTPGTSYRATFFSVGFDADSFVRRITFSSPAGESTVGQNTYGDNQGIRLDHTFTATDSTHTVTLAPVTEASFHLYALALGVESKVPLTYADWKQAEFGVRAFERGLADDNDDPDGDDIPNFLEYALRLDPGVSDPSSFGLPESIVLPGAVEARRFTLPYQPNSGDIVYRIRHSADLITWTDAYRLDLATGVSSQLSGVTGATDSAAQTLTVTITDPGLFGPSSFWALTVEKP